MKFFSFFLIVSFTFLSSSFAKILNIENKIQIEVPSSHKFIKYNNEETTEFINELKDSIDGLEVDFYLVGPSKYVDLEQALVIDGEDPMENEYIKSIIKNLKKCGAKEIHVRIPAPPVIDICELGISIQSKEELIMNNKTTDEVCNEIGANSLKYLHIDDLEHFPENSYNQCFTGFIDPEIKPR